MNDPAHRASPLRGVIVGSMLLLCAAQAVAQVDPSIPTGAPPGEAAKPPVGGGADADYRIGPGDLLYVNVYRAVDLAGPVRVDGNGTINMPGIGALQVANLTAADVANKISAELKSRGILINPSVNVLVTDVRSNVVEVMGQVARPGTMPLDRPGLTLAAVLARAGANFGTGSGVVTVVEPDGHRESFMIADLISGAHDRAARPREILVVQSAALVYVGGEVGRPGSFPVERGMTVEQAIAMGGGTTPRGTLGRIKLTRKNPDGSVTVKNGVKPNTLVQPDDTIRVGQRIF